MNRPVKTKWTPEAERRAANMWNAQQPTELICKTIYAEFGIVVNEVGVQALQKRKGGALGMIEGSDRRRAARPSRPSSNAKKKAKTLKTAKPPSTWLAIADDEHVEGTDFMDLTAKQCRYPLTKSLPHKFCSDQAVVGSWCAKHLEIIKGKAKK